MSRHHTSHPIPAKRLLALVDAEPKLCPNCDEPECDCSEEDKGIAALSDCSGVPNKKTGRHERCAWVEKSDWMGDPTLHRGTVSWKWAECLACGAEVQEPYPQWLDRALPQREAA